MSKTFKGRALLPGKAKGEIIVSNNSMNTLATYRKAIITKSRKAVCSDQNNPDLYKKNLSNKIICLPQTSGSTTGGLALMAIAGMGTAPKALLFSENIDSLAAAGVILTEIWLSSRIITIDGLGQEFLDYAQTGMDVEIKEDGTVILS